jgi:hypothetical protein
MTIAKTRFLVAEVLDTCRIDARTRSLLQKALAESWQTAPIRPPRENAPPGVTPQARRGDVINEAGTVYRT